MSLQSSSGISRRLFDDDNSKQEPTDIGDIAGLDAIVLTDESEIPRTTSTLDFTDAAEADNSAARTPNNSVFSLSSEIDIPSAVLGGRSNDKTSFVSRLEAWVSKTKENDSLLLHLNGQDLRMKAATRQWQQLLTKEIETAEQQMTAVFDNLYVTVPTQDQAKRLLEKQQSKRKNWQTQFEMIMNEYSKKVSQDCQHIDSSLEEKSIALQRALQVVLQQQRKEQLELESRAADLERQRDEQAHGKELELQLQSDLEAATLPIEGEMLSNLALAQQMMDEASSEDEAFDDDFNDDLFVEFQRQEANEKI